MTDPGSEMTAIVCGITFLIIFFSGLVIYSIYYVCVITDVQEIGKLKAIGASKKQVWKMLLTEGFFVSLMALPPGLVIGFLIPRQCFPVIVQKGVAAMAAAPVGDLDMFSFPVLLLVIFVVLFTVSISLLKPMRLASKISPMEAIRYQESKVDGKKRKLNKDKPVNLFSLTAANLMRNKKRTVVTMVTMGLSCVLFMSLSGVLNSADPEDIARRNIPEGDFSLFLECEWNDKEYPENNLNYVQKSDYFNGDFVDSLRSLPGVEKVTVKESVLIGSDNSDSELFEKGRRVDLSHFDKDEAREYEKELKRGNIDYDAMVAENGALFTSDIFMDDYGFSVGDIVSLTVYDGDRKIPLDITISGSLNSGDSSYFMIPEEVYQKLNLTTNTATDLYITVNEKQYEAVKSTLQEFTDANAFFRFYSMDEELKIGRMAVNVIKYPMYLILMMVALISFMNLINTMITSIVTRKREMGMLQAIGLSNRQLKKMIAGEGLVFTCGTLIVSVTVGNFFGYLLFLWAKANKFMSISNYHYPFVETLVLVGLLLVGQVLIGYFINKRIQKESLIERIRSGE